jgi:phosphoglycolate phosphatase
MIIAFDLDGTISDPIVGVSASINYALEKLGLPKKEQAALETYIGPPLQDIFSDLLGYENDELIHSAITFFRERYFDIGFRENVIYPGIKELLKWLTANGHKLYIATSKKTTIGKAVADLFEIAKYFDEILGCGLKRKKHQLLNYIKEKENTESLVMIGDRLHDMKAGRACHCFCIGVLWGYGSKEELIGSGANVTCNAPNDIKGIINRMHNHRFHPMNG